MVDDVRVRGTGRSGLRLEDAPKAQTGPPRVDKVSGPVCAHPPTPTGTWGQVWTGRTGDSDPTHLTHPTPPQMTQCYFEGGYQETPVYLLGELGYGHKLQGPCLIIDSNRWAATWPGGPWGCRWWPQLPGPGCPWPADVGSLVWRGVWPGLSRPFASLSPAPSW